jgi:hypothetical protein
VSPLLDAEDPLADGDVGQDAVHEVRGPGRHGAAAAGGAQGATVASERDDLGRATGASQQGKALAGLPAVPEPVEVPNHMARHESAAFFGEVDQGRHAAKDGVVE